MIYDDGYMNYYKWGADGNGCQKKYKQNFEKEDSDDSNIFITSFVPLRLSCEQNNTVIWHNVRTGSTRFCRPIRLQFVKETVDTKKSEFNYIEPRIANFVGNKQ